MKLKWLQASAPDGTMPSCAPKAAYCSRRTQALAWISCGLLTLHVLRPWTCFGQEPPVLTIQKRSAELDLRWRSSSLDASGRATTYQLQTSDDLNLWSPIGDPVRADNNPKSAWCRLS